MIEKKIRQIVKRRGIAYNLKNPEWVLDAIMSSQISPSSNSILINGFWRSGTTWLLEVVSQAWRAKPVFEPLIPRLKSYKPYLKAQYSHMMREDGTFVDGLMPYCDAPMVDCPQLTGYLELVLSGGSLDYFTRLTRESIRERRGHHSRWRLLRVAYRIQDGLQTRVVTKFVRAHLILPALIQRYGMPVLHIRRDPRAVVASLKRQKWADWIRQTNLSTLLLETNDGRETYFSRWDSDIRRLDDHSSYIARLAGYWSLTERYVEEHTDNSKVIFVQFEDLCRGHEEYFNELISDTVKLHAKKDDFAAESKTSNRKTDIRSVEDRLGSWESDLSAGEARTVEQVVSDLGMEKYLVT